MKRFVLFCLECQAPNTSARDWHEGSYASILYPNAKMDDRRTDEFLKSVGTKEEKSSFLKSYYSSESFQEGDEGRRRQHVHHQQRPLPVHDHLQRQREGLHAPPPHRGHPRGRFEAVLFQGDPGRHLDSTTLKKTIIELGKHGIKVPLALLDAGYCNPRRLAGMGIDFIARLDAKMKTHNELKGKCLDGLEAKENFIRYGGKGSSV